MTIPERLCRRIDREVARIEFGCLSGGEPRVFYLRDNGIGFAAQDAERIFTPFSRLHPTEFEGHGLGRGKPGQGRHVLFHAGRRLSEMILLVDDDLDDRQLVRTALEQAHIDAELVEADDGVKALEILARRVPRLVFLDLKLPRLDGFEVLRRLRLDPRLAAVPVLVYSGSDERSDVERAYAAGADGYLRKPADFPVLLRNISIAASFWLEVNVPRSAPPA